MQTFELSDDLGNADLAFLTDLPTTCFDKLVCGVHALHCSPWNMQSRKDIFQSTYSQND